MFQGRGDNVFTEGGPDPDSEAEGGGLSPLNLTYDFLYYDFDTTIILNELFINEQNAPSTNISKVSTI